MLRAMIQADNESFAHNPALSSLGRVCALGVFCCLVSSVVFILPAYRALKRSSGEQAAR